MQAIGMGLARLAGSGLSRLALTAGLQQLGQRALDWVGNKVASYSAADIGRSIASIGGIGTKAQNFLGGIVGKDMAGQLVGMAQQKVGNYVSRRSMDVVNNLKERWDNAESVLKKRQAEQSREFTRMEPIKFRGGGNQTSYRMGNDGYRTRIKDTGRNSFGDLANYLNST